MLHCDRIFAISPIQYADSILKQSVRLRSVELKQTAFRIDSVFLPPNNAQERPVYFVEVQFQKEPYLYHQFFAKIFLFLDQNKLTNNWHAVVIYPRRSIEPDKT